MEPTKSEAVRRHRKMWNWIADETDRLKFKVEKCEYFYNFEIEDIPSLECYCCEYLFNLGNCKCLNGCPIDWGNYFGCQKPCLESLYKLWCLECDWQKAANLAREIANLPERPDMEFDVLEEE
ncbi:hypothetical protein [Eubacterium barkeri]|uniref:Uncharacterized protein n=1 Tax=Eubacterium barkeri TaxID=1528 RepID=A0A1H3IQ98_EUBBA|nr:hypothetical protein [Eubacterium barkeri]SDY29880.1 hypothetical protein SAMN04488579_12440 [Eubacterium barkeri]